MPTDRLNTTTIADAVLSVMAGSPVAEAAVRADLDPAVLVDAVELFHQAGLQALTEAEERVPSCRQVYLEFADWSTAETVAA